MIKCTVIKWPDKTQRRWDNSAFEDFGVALATRDHINEVGASQEHQEKSELQVRKYNYFKNEFWVYTDENTIITSLLHTWCLVVVVVT